MRAPVIHPFQEFFDHLSTDVKVTAQIASVAAAVASVALAAAVAAAAVTAALVSLLRRRVSSF